METNRGADAPSIFKLAGKYLAKIHSRTRYDAEQCLEELRVVLSKKTELRLHMSEVEIEELEMVYREAVLFFREDNVKNVRIDFTKQIGRAIATKSKAALESFGPAEATEEIELIY